MRVAGFFLAVALVAPSLADAETKTTVHTYNADGALTSITEMSDGGSKTTYFTWDNFEADPNTPSTGTVTAANGNLIGIGTTPGDDSVSSWHHDVLDRLVRVTHGQGDKALYQYHPDELLAASLNADAPSTDGLQHYYDESHYPQVTNLYDRHTGELSSRHHQIRYLEDGTEQMLVRHRKDVDGVYNLGQQTMSGYQYDPYGASLAQELTGPSPGPLYSVRNNPYRYTHELQDPVSGAYYLRARWYLPGHQTFLQRDPVRNLNRYGYANGNPITNYDPGGRDTKKFFRAIEANPFGGGLLSALTLGILPIAQQGKKFWQHRASFVVLQLSMAWTSAATVFGFSPALGILTGATLGPMGALFLPTIAGGVGIVQVTQAIANDPRDGEAVVGRVAGSFAGGFALGLGGSAFGFLSGLDVGASQVGVPQVGDSESVSSFDSNARERVAAALQRQGGSEATSEAGAATVRLEKGDAPKDRPASDFDVFDVRPTAKVKVTQQPPNIADNMLTLHDFTGWDPAKLDLVVERIEKGQIRSRRDPILGGRDEDAKDVDAIFDNLLLSHEHKTNDSVSRIAPLR